MGNESSSNKKKFKKFDKNKLDILLKQIYFTAQLAKDRKKGQQNSKEKELLAFLREPANKRSKENEYSKASAIVNDIKSVKAHEWLMRYADILKDNQMVIQLSQGDTSKINDLIPYVESLIWGCQRCNIVCIKDFEEFLSAHFGKESLAKILELKKVLPEIQSLFTLILPSEKEVKLFLIEFANKHGISLDHLNEVGHKLSPSEMADLPDPNQPKNDGGNQGNQGSFNSGGFPQSGYPQYPNFQPTNPTYPNPGYGGYQPISNQYQHPPGYQPTNPGHQQPTNYGYHPNNYPSFNPQGYPSPYTPQGGSGGNYPYNPINQGYQQQSGPNSFTGQEFQPSYQPQNPDIKSGLQDYKKNPGPENSGSDFGGYPNFQSMAGAPTNGKSGFDPLDELDLRLKNIKGGL